MIYSEQYDGGYIYTNYANAGIGFASQYLINVGASSKSGINTLRGQLKVDNRPSGGSTGDYAEQIRAEVGKTSGTYIGLDNETHLIVSGTTSLRGTQGVTVVDSGYTLTGGTLNGLYGQARVDGTIAGSSFVAGIYGLIEASSAMTASHVASAWLDSHQANAVTGEHELLYMTNNGAATMDQAIYLYGGDKITNLVNLNTVSGMVSAGVATNGGGSKKIKIVIDGTTYYINAYDTP